MKPTGFFAGSDIVVIDHNPEMADYDNPRGEVYGYFTYVVAEDNDGYRCSLHVETVSVHVGETVAMRRAEALARALAARLNSGKLPVAFNGWAAMQPAYGSEAYIRENCEEDLIAWEREHDYA